MGGKVLVPMREHADRLNAARLQCDVMGSSTLIIARTDAEAATFITVGVDFATTQLVDGRVLLYAIDATPARWCGDGLISTQVDGNWGVHAEIPKAMFEATA